MPPKGSSLRKPTDGVAMRPPGVGVPSTGATLGAGSWQSGTGRAAPGPRGLGFGRADRQGGRNFREWPPRSEHPAPSPAATRPSVWVCVCAWSAHHRPHTSGGLPLALASPLMAHKSQGRGRAHGSMVGGCAPWRLAHKVSYCSSWLREHPPHLQDGCRSRRWQQGLQIAFL